jgi:RNA polymerase sigma factor (sigma-70 family)
MVTNMPSESDGALLAKFAGQGDEIAFEALVRRHAPLVLGVCRRVLGNTSDAEDTAQSVFILLAEKATELTDHPCLDGWLHRAARHIALRQKQASGRRRQRESAAMVKDAANLPAPSADREDLRRLLDRELDALPNRYRQPLILHYLQGKSQEEAAGLLGCSYGTLSGRLNRARALLKQRLERHGAVISIGALSMVCADSMAGIPPAFAATVMQAVSSGATFSSAGLGSAASFSTAAASWPLKIAAAVALGSGALVGTWASLRPAAPPATITQPPPSVVPMEVPVESTDTATIRSGTTSIRIPGYTLWPKRGVLMQDGSVIVLAQRSLAFDVPNEQIEAGLVRCDRHGTMDETFGDAGWAQIRGGCFAYGLAAQGDAGIVAAAAASTGQDRVLMVRFDGSGRADLDFGDGGVIERPIEPDVNDGGSAVIRVDERNRILLMRQYSGTTYVDRFDAHGRPDLLFGHDGEVAIAIGSGGGGLSLMVDRGIIVAGAAGREQDASGAVDLFLARFRDDGAPDVAFGTGGVATVAIGGGGPRGAQMTRAADGSLLVHGQFIERTESIAGVERELDAVYVQRCRADGLPEGGVRTIAHQADRRSVVFCALPQPDGKIVMGVAARTDLSLEATTGMIMERHGSIIRIDAEGGIDRTFGVDGEIRGGGDWAFDLLQRADGAFVAIGVDFDDPDAMPIIISQYRPDGSFDPDFGDAAGVPNF